MRRADAVERPVYQRLTAEACRELRAGQEVAARLMGRFPDWLIMWGPGSREFWAFPAWDGGPAKPVSSANPRELAEELHATQMAAAARNYGWAESSSPRRQEPLRSSYHLLMEGAL